MNFFEQRFAARFPGTHGGKYSGTCPDGWQEKWGKSLEIVSRGKIFCPIGGNKGQSKTKPDDAA
jgi:hypothetical protein